MSFPDGIFRRSKRNQTPNLKAKNMLAKLFIKYISPYLKSWKTSLAGIGSIASGVAILSGVGVAAADGEISTDQAILGWGLIAAGLNGVMGKDANVVGK